MVALTSPTPRPSPKRLLSLSLVCATLFGGWENWAWIPRGAKDKPTPVPSIIMNLSIIHYEWLFFYIIQVKEGTHPLTCPVLPICIARERRPSASGVMIPERTMGYFGWRKDLISLVERTTPIPYNSEVSCISRCEMVDLRCQEQRRSTAPQHSSHSSHSQSVQ